MIHFDGDALVYIAGFAADSRNGPFSHSAHNVKLIINKVLKQLEDDEYRIFLTSKDPEVNFRTSILDSYKKNRSKKCYKCYKEHKKVFPVSKESYVDSVKSKDGLMKRRFYTCLNCDSPVADTKPVYYSKIRRYLVEQFDATICEWGEADDWLGIGLTDHDWIATHDKDLRMLPFNYYNLKTEQTYNHSDPGEIELKYKKDTQTISGIDGYGFKWFCIQMLTGDKVDNIDKPYKGDGPKWIYNVFNPLTTELECWKMVELYYKFTGNENLLWDNAMLLWIAREPYQVGDKKTIYNTIRGSK